MTSLLNISSKSQNVGTIKKWHTWPSQRVPSCTWVQPSVKNIQGGSRPLHVLTLWSGYTTTHVIYIFHFAPQFPSLSALLLIDHQSVSSFCSLRLLDGMYTRHLLRSTLSYPFFFFFFRLPRNGYPSPRRSNTYNHSHFERLYSYTTLLMSAFRLLHFFIFIFHVHFMFLSLSTEISCCKLFYRTLHFILSSFLSFDLFLPTHCKCRGL